MGMLVVFAVLVIVMSLNGVYAVVLDTSATFDDLNSAAPTLLNIDFALCAFLSSTFMAVLTSVDAVESVVTLDLCSPSFIFGSGCFFKIPVHLSAILYIQCCRLVFVPFVFVCCSFFGLVLVRWEKSGTKRKETEKREKKWKRFRWTSCFLYVVC